MKKNIIAIIFFFFCMIILSAEEKIDSGAGDYSSIFYGSQLFQECYETYLLEKTQSFDLKNWWLPGITFSLAGSACGDWYDSPSGYVFSPEVSISQNLPGGIVLGASLNHNLYIYDYGDVSHNYDFRPAVSFSIPLISGQKLLNRNLESTLGYGKNCWLGIEKRFDLMQRENRQKFVDYISCFLYYKKLSEVLEERRKLFMQQEEYYDSLVDSGQASFLQRWEKIGETFDITEEIAYIEAKILDCESFLRSAGIDNNSGLKLENVVLEDFIEFWLKEVDFLLLEGDYDFREQTELNSLEISFDKSVVSLVRQLPVFQAQFSVDPGNEKFGTFCDFSHSSWKADFSVTLPVLKGNDFFSSGKNFSHTEKLYYIERNKIISKIEEKDRLVKKNREIYMSFVEKLDHQKNVETRRFSDYKHLLELGKISELDYMLQENSKNLCELYVLKAKIDYVNKMMSFL